jgi:hypothetical protein
MFFRSRRRYDRLAGESGVVVPVGFPQRGLLLRGRQDTENSSRGPLKAASTGNGCTTAAGFTQAFVKA